MQKYVVNRDDDSFRFVPLCFVNGCSIGQIKLVRIPLTIPNISTARESDKERFVRIIAKSLYCSCFAIEHTQIIIVFQVNDRVSDPDFKPVSTLVRFAGRIEFILQDMVESTGAQISAMDRGQDFDFIWGETVLVHELMH